MLRKLLGRFQGMVGREKEGPCPVGAHYPSAPTTLSPHIFPEHWVPCQVRVCGRADRPQEAQHVLMGDITVLLEWQEAHPEIQGSECWNLEMRQSRSSWSRLGPVYRCNGISPTCSHLPPTEQPFHTGPASSLKPLELRLPLVH